MRIPSDVQFKGNHEIVDLKVIYFLDDQLSITIAMTDKLR